MAGSFLLWRTPDRDTRPAPASGDVPLLPGLPGKSSPPKLPEHFSLFNNTEGNAAPSVELAMGLGPQKTKADHRYRLCAYAGGNGFWVASLEDESGHYHTVRTGELLPDSTLQFQGMEFHAEPSGMQQGCAVFLDRTDSSRVDFSTLANLNQPTH